MNRLKFFLLFALISLGFLTMLPVQSTAGVKGGAVTVYNSGRALIKDVRTVTLPKGLASVVIKDVPATIDPTSIRVFSQGMQVLDSQYSYLPITTKNLLDRYIGKELTVILPDPSDADGRMLRKATLVSNADRPIFLVGKEVYVGNYEALLLPELPTELHEEPTLTLTTDNETEGKKQVELNYLMGGLTWRADYALSVDAAGNKGALDGWATLDNRSGQPFTSTDLKRVAGDVQQVAAPRRAMAKGAMLMETDMAAAPGQPVQESFSQYHVYSVPRLVNLPASGVKQIGLFSASSVGIGQQLISRFHGGTGQRGGAVKQSVQLELTVANTEANGLGKPVPAGLVRVYMPTSDGRQLLAGESGIPHVSEGSDIKLTLGRAFDVTVERSQASFKKTGKQSYEIGWRIDVRNSKDSAVNLRLLDAYSGQWDVITSSHKYARQDAGTLRFDLDVPPGQDGQPMILTYTIRVTY